MEPKNIRPGKWTAVVDDILVPMPQRVVKASVVTAQAAVPDGRVLVRDHNLPEDAARPSDTSEAPPLHAAAVFSERPSFLSPSSQR